MTKLVESRLLMHTGAQYPIICGAMYPCSNPELVGAASEAGGIGIVQPVSLVYAHGYEFRAGLKYIRTLTQKPIGLNLLVEKSAKRYEDRLKEWLDISLEEGVRFFVTALGNPSWVIEKVRPLGGIVYHDVTNEKWAQKAVDSGVDGLICVNNRAGGHLGTESPEELFKHLSRFGLPLVCAGGVGSKEEHRAMLAIGYEGVQLGTRFVASKECSAHEDYKNAILKAKAIDIVATDKISGVPVSIIKTAYIEKMGIESSHVARWFLKHPKFKHYMRLIYTVKSVFQLKKSNQRGSSYKDFFQAGKSVESIDRIEPVRDIIQGLVSDD
ncbi:MAG: nitronate monooxygenase [Proteobacteria bacterium]|nr:nitronate monooxygenase [Pseudomonadota bacterium]